MKGKYTMKKALMIALALALIFCGCAAPAQTSEEPAPQTDMVEKAELDSANAKIAELESELADVKAQLKTAQEESASYLKQIEAYEAEKAAKENGAVASLDKAVQLHDDEYVTISYIGCENDSLDRPQVVLLVQNKTDYTLTFQADSLSLDGFGLGRPRGSDEVAPQSKGKIHFRFDEEPESMTPATISATLSVIDFSKEMTGKQSYDVTIVNADVSSAYES